MLLMNLTFGIAVCFNHISIVWFKTEIAEMVVN